MKCIRFEYNGDISYGVIEGDKVFYTDEKYLKKENAPVLLDDVKLLAPCLPTKIIAVGLNYVDHIKEMGHDMPTTPVVFNKLPQTVIGPLDDIVIPEKGMRVDYEAELCVVIKKEGFKLTKEEVSEYILGASCLNDVTAREIQSLDGQWTRAKNYETFCPIGPHIETEIDWNNAPIQLRLNGKVRQKSNTSNFLWKAEELVAFVSRFVRLYPQDVITTGTSSGIGPMNVGDVVEVEIEGIGILKNNVR